MGISVETLALAKAFTRNYLKDHAGTIYNYKGVVKTFSNLPSSAAVGDVYNVTEAYGANPKNTNYAWNGSKWEPINSLNNMSDTYTKSEIDSRVDTKLSKTSNGQPGQFAVSNGDGSVGWVTITNRQEVGA